MSFWSGLHPVANSETSLWTIEKKLKFTFQTLGQQLPIPGGSEKKNPSKL